MINFFDNRYLGQYWDDIEGALNEYENFISIMECGGENIPSFFPDYGPGIMASVFGIEPKLLLFKNLINFISTEFHSNNFLTKFK